MLIYTPVVIILIPRYSDCDIAKVDVGDLKADFINGRIGVFVPSRRALSMLKNEMLLAIQEQRLALWVKKN